MAARSAGGRSESEPNADASEGMPRLRIEIPERGSETLILPGLEPELRHEFHRGEIDPAVHEQYFAGAARIDHDGSHARWPVVEANVRLTGSVVVDAQSRRHVEQRELPAHDRAAVVGPHVHPELELSTGNGRRRHRAGMDARERPRHP